MLSTHCFHSPTVQYCSLPSVALYNCYLPRSIQQPLSQTNKDTNTQPTSKSTHTFALNPNLTMQNHLYLFKHLLFSVPNPNPIPVRRATKIESSTKEEINRHRSLLQLSLQSAVIFGYWSFTSTLERINISVCYSTDHSRTLVGCVLEL
jgi:uncharacterized protein YcsI (UPF0317 family)